MNKAKDDTGIVVLGAPRTGTTLLRRLLSAHPRIDCSGETFLLRATAQFLKGDTVADGIDYGVLGGLQSAGIDREEVIGRLRIFAFALLDEIAAKSGKSRWASKSAIDSFYIPEIDLIFGGHVKFVCILRHGLDTACSMRELCDVNGTYIKELHRYIIRYAAPLEAFTHAWSDVTRSILDLAGRRPEDAIVLRYEDLVSDPEAVLADLFRFLGEDYEADLSRRVFSKADVQGLGDWKTYATRRIQKSSVGRYSELSDATISRLAAISNPVLELAGYDLLPVLAPPEPDDAMRRYEMELTLKAVRAEDSGDE